MEVHRKRLLLVEDNPVHAKLMILQLAALGKKSEVEWVKDGEAALEHLQTGPLPDLVLLDLKMPRLDGHEVLRVMKSDERLRRIPVVMVTTSSREEDISTAYDLGVNAYLVKPVDFIELRSMLCSVVEFWSTWNRVCLSAPCRGERQAAAFATAAAM